MADWTLVRSRAHRQPFQPYSIPAPPIPVGAVRAHPLARFSWLTDSLAQHAEAWLVGALLAVALLAHGLNMFNFPSFTLKEDEGIYAEQAWAVLKLGELAPYTYTYDHAPGGWILVGLWYAVSGGHTTFGGAIQSGRVLMLLLHLAMVPLLFHLARKLGAGPVAAGLAALLFSVSPLAIFYQRMLLLDTIMLFWVLISLDLLLNGWGSLSRTVLSGTCFGLAVLSKETAVFLLPVLLVISFLDRRHHQGRFAVFGWLVPMLMVVSLYPLFALLKGELLPAADASHVSLIGSLGWQASRGGGGAFNLNNDFWQLLRGDWLPRDPVLILGGAVAVAANLARGIRDRRAMTAALLGVLPLAYLARGGLVLDFYVLAAIPFLCLNVAIALAPLLGRLPGPAATALGTVLAIATFVGWWGGGLLRPLYVERPSDVGREALAWISQHVPAESKIITRDDFWTALRDPGTGGTAYAHAHSHWKVAQDPAVRDGEFGDDWHNVDYLIMWGRGLEDDFRAADNQVALGAIQNARMVKSWVATEGDEAIHPRPAIELWKVDRPGVTEATLLSESARYQRLQFERDGAFVDRNGIVTSEAQSYAMLRAVWSDDRAAFDRAWGWTRTNLRRPDGLLSWVWQNGTITDPSAATDADTDTALALLLAGRKWNDPSLIDEGTRMVRAIWEHEVAVVGDAPYITAGDWATSGPVVGLNPSYLAPYAYGIFAEVDSDHNWWWLIDTSYRVLFESARSPLGAEKSAGLPPDWVGLDRQTGEFVRLDLPGVETTRYGYDAARTYWRVALHHRWTADGRAEAFLQQSGFLSDEVTRVLGDGISQKGTVSAVYARDGRIEEEQSSIVGEAGALAALLTKNPPAGHQLFTTRLVARANRSGAGASWGDPRDLYAQEWGWFATALYADALPDLWHAPDSKPRRTS